MASYIELNKQSSFPPSSGAGKVIFGVNSSGNITLTNSSGLTTPIGASPSGGGGCSVAPCPGDFIALRSYAKWINGTPRFGPSSDENKFEVIANQYDISDYLTLELVGGQASGCGISSCQYTPITVNDTNVTFRDDGYGLAASNYVDFINSIFTGQGLYTTMSATTDPDFSFYSDFCKLDDFVFIFKEIGQINGSPLPTVYSALTGRYGTYLADTIGGSIDAIFYTLLTGSSLNNWQER